MLHCSFCAKSEKEIAKLAAGPGGLRICDEYVDACRLVMDGEIPVARDFAPGNWPTERLLTMFAPLERTVHAYREHLSDVVAALRQREVSWAKIAEPLGVARQSAWERFS